MERILFIGAAVLLIFGPEKVPEIARALGNLTREFQNALHPPPEAPAAAPAPKRPAARRRRARRRSR
ncbi:MAG TPA: twin-arginine translocase TatA/TatE family subunit [bacterium]|nr:twin-arginine translocase TatA/TatE family subunit [bacterium]